MVDVFRDSVAKNASPLAPKSDPVFVKSIMWFNANKKKKKEKKLHDFAFQYCTVSITKDVRFQRDNVHAVSII